MSKSSMLVRANLACRNNQAAVKPHNGQPRRIELRQKLYEDGVAEMYKVVPPLVKAGAKTLVETVADLIPLHYGDWILLNGDQFVGVQLHWGDARIRIRPSESPVNPNDPWDQYLIGDAKTLIFDEVKELAKQNDLAGLKREARDFIQSRHFMHEDSPNFIAGFGDLDLPGAWFVPFFRNGTTPEIASQYYSDKRRYSLELGGACSQRRKIYDVWATRLWDYENDHEVVGSRFCSYDLESAVSAAVSMIHDLEG